MQNVTLISPQGRRVTALEEDVEAMIQHAGYKRSAVDMFSAAATNPQPEVPVEDQVQAALKILND